MAGGGEAAEGGAGARAGAGLRWLRRCYMFMEGIPSVTSNSREMGIFIGFEPVHRSTGSISCFGPESGFVSLFFPAAAVAFDRLFGGSGVEGGILSSRLRFMILGSCNS